MTNVELWMNIAVILLLIPTVFYAALLSRRLGKMQQNQQRMIELAEALRHAADIYDAGEKNAAPDQTDSQPPIAAETLPATPFFEARPTPGFDQPDFDQPTNDETPHFTAPSFTAADEEPSEAELELLQALRSIKQ